MAKNKLSVNYPSSHLPKTEINFFNTAPDLCSIYNPGDEKNDVRHFFITDATVATLECMQSFVSKFDGDFCGKDRLLILGSGEHYKTIESALKIIQLAIEAGFTRKDVFVGIGGGVISDLTAFSASIYKRGAGLELVPTTLLSMVDASIGGKTGCDFENYKNMIGTFYTPAKIYCFYDFIQYLPENQYNSGLAEAFKAAILFDPELYDIFKTQADKINSRDKELLSELIFKCAQAKAKIVYEDFTEQNIRAVLNLGHTFGHALESIMGLGSITHGQAVAWGIGRAVTLSHNKEYCSEAFKNEILSILEKYNWETAPVPSIVQGGGIGERFLKVMKTDKKNIAEKIRLVIPKGVTETLIEEVEDRDILAVLK